MINIIITGHGNFATGMKSGLELIAGEQDEIIALDFLGEDDGTELMMDLQQKTSNSPTLVFTDLYGGTPFRTAFKLAYENGKIGVITGTNLGMLLEILPSLKTVNSIEELLKQIEGDYSEHFSTFIKNTDD